jgi:L,D-transpeptidase ErfK/SrfK
MKLFYSQSVYFSKSSQKFLNCIFLTMFLFANENANSIEIFSLEKNSTVVGNLSTVIVNENETVADMANRYKTGFQDLLIANPDSHHWSPKTNTEYVIPSMYILPQAEYNGIILNLAELRLYFYIKGEDLYENTKVITYPVGIGRLDWKTPLGETFIKNKVANPTWFPPKSIIKEHEEMGKVLPRMVKAGPKNPLGEYALKLNVDGGYLLHGTNKKYGIGMMVSHGCIRLRNEDIETIYFISKRGTKVKIINEPIKIGKFKDFLYMEVHAFNNQEVYSNNQKNYLTTENIYKPVKPVMSFLENNPEYEIDWKNVFKAYEESKGIPIIIGKKNSSKKNLVQAHSKK